MVHLHEKGGTQNYCIVRFFGSRCVLFWMLPFWGFWRRSQLGSNLQANLQGGSRGERQKLELGICLFMCGLWGGIENWTRALFAANRVEIYSKLFFFNQHKMDFGNRGKYNKFCAIGGWDLMCSVDNFKEIFVKELG